MQHQLQFFLHLISRWVRAELRPARTTTRNSEEKPFKKLFQNEMNGARALLELRISAWCPDFRTLHTFLTKNFVTFFEKFVQAGEGGGVKSSISGNSH